MVIAFRFWLGLYPAATLAGAGLLAAAHTGDAFAEDEQAEARTELDLDDLGEQADQSDIADGEENEISRLLTMEGSVALGYENFVPADDPDTRVSDAFASIEAEIALNFSENAWIDAVLAYEPVTDPDFGEDRFFDDHGLFAEQLYAAIEAGPAIVQAGKIAPTFGWAADDAAGLYGGEFPGDYELVEQLGVSARVSLWETSLSGDRTIEHALNGALFTADTTFLSDSLFTSRGGLDVSDGGVGNTGSPESVAVAYTILTRDADDEVAGRSFQAAIRRLAQGEGDERSEWGFLAAFEDRYAMGHGVSLSPIFEAAYFLHAGGESEDAFAATIGGELAAGNWRASSNFSLRDVFGDDDGARDYAITADVGRIFHLSQLGEIRADIGYMFSREDMEDIHVIGVQLEREFAFGLSR